MVNKNDDDKEVEDQSEESEEPVDPDPKLESTFDKGIKQEDPEKEEE